VAPPLIKDFNRNISLTDDIERLTLKTAPGRNEYEGVLAALAGSDRKAALALVTDLMSIAGTTNVGGRTVAEIADRFSRTGNAEGGRPAARRHQHHQALSFDRGRAGWRGGAIARAGIRRQAQHHRGDRPVREPRRLHDQARIDTRKTRFSTSFGRGLDYYTGLRIRVAPQRQRRGAAGRRGRYDGLMTQLVQASRSCGRLLDLGRCAGEGRQKRERGMTVPFVLAVPIERPPAGKRRSFLHPPQG